MRADHVQEACLEQVTIPPGRSFLWRMDDYPWRRAVWNYHPEFEVHLIRHSTGLAYVGDYIGSFEAGHLCVIGSNLPHNWVTPNIGEQSLVARDIVLQFDANTIRRSSDVFPELSVVSNFLDRSARGLEFFGDSRTRATALLERIGAGPPDASVGPVLDLIHLLATSEEYRYLASEAFAKSLTGNSEETQDRIERALAFIQDNFLDRPAQEDVAALVGMSPSAFSRFFKAKTGNTFLEHLISLRIYTARKMLAETDEPITEICFMSGFSNISNFNRTFLREVGMSPSAYRRWTRERA